MATSSINYDNYIPGFKEYIERLNSDFSEAMTGGSSYGLINGINAEKQKAIAYIKNPNSPESLAYEKNLFDNNASMYGQNAIYGNDQGNLKDIVIKQASYLTKTRNIAANDIQKEINDQVNSGVEYAKENIKEEQKINNNWVNKVFTIAEVVGIGYLTAGLGSAIAAELGVSAIAGNALASLTLNIAQGQDVGTALKNAVASAGGAVAGDELLKGMKGITDPAVASTLANSVKYGTEAALKGQDIMKALEAGAVGGAVAAGSTAVTDNSTTMSVQDQKDIAKALGTFTAARTQGLSTEQALASATAGFAASEVNQVRDAILKDAPAQTQEQAGSQNQGNISNAGNLSQGGVQPSTSISDDKVLSPVEVTAQSVYDPALLSDYQVTKQEGSQQFPVTNKFQNNVLLSYINQTPGLSGVKNFGYNPQYNPQSANQNIAQAASAQALQTGSPDSPFQDPKEGGKRKNVWNQASLRTMDETGSTA